jgi:predicted transposase YbfD/YdcC
MEDSTAPASSEAVGTAPVVFALSSLWRCLAAVQDHRKRRGKRYALPLLLLLLILAKLSGEDRPSGIAEWVALRRTQLAQVLGIRLPRAPHHNTYRRVLALAVAPGDLDAAVGAFFRALPQVGTTVLVSIDGKTLKGTIDAAAPHGEHLLVAYLPQEGIVLLQVPTGEKRNEINVAPALIQGLDLRGKVVAADALHTQRAFSAQILAAGGDYLLVAKENQPTLRADIETLFTDDARTVEGGQFPQDFHHARQVHKGHGRREIRQLTVSSALKGYTDWPGLEQVFCLERERIASQSGHQEREVTYGLTSLTPAAASPGRLLELTRAYWGVENGLHYRRDVTFHEDATRLTQGHAGHVMASLNNLAIGLLRLAGFTNLAAARRYCDADLANALALLSPTPRT